MGVATGLGLAVVLFLIANQLLKLAFRKRYKVSETGAVVLSGASTGIGHHAARHLAARGFTVYATVRKQKDVDALNSLGLPTLVPVIMDVAKPVGGCCGSVGRVWVGPAGRMHAFCDDGHGRTTAECMCLSYLRRARR